MPLLFSRSAAVIVLSEILSIVAVCPLYENLMVNVVLEVVIIIYS